MKKIIILMISLIFLLGLSATASALSVSGSDGLSLFSFITLTPISYTIELDSRGTRGIFTNLDDLTTITFTRISFSGTADYDLNGLSLGRFDSGDCSIGFSVLDCTLTSAVSITRQTITATD